MLIISYANITIHWKQLRLSKMKCQVFALIELFIRLADSLISQSFPFADGRNTEKSLADEHYTGNKTRVEYALQFIMEELYTSITKNPSEVR